MAEIIKKSVMAIVKEVTEGVPVLPSASTDYVALQSGFSVTPEFSNLENAELKGSVAKAAPIIGAEAPKASVSHYLRHSGVVAVAPQFSPLIEAAIGEMVAASGSERLTTAGSTAGTSSAAAVVELAAGGGDFQRGKAVLLKMGTGYELRPVHSVVSNSLTLGFNLPTAPASGIGCGRSILFKPNDVPPTLTGSFFDGQGGALEVAAGLRVTDMTVTAKAKELINTSFSLEGLSYYFDPIEIVTGTNDTMDFNDGAAKTAIVAGGLYDNPNSLATALQDAMNSVSSGITVIYNNDGASAGKFTISKTSGTLNLLFATGPNTSDTIAPAIGFTVADETGFLTYTSDVVQSWASPQTPSFDAGEPLVCKSNEFMLGDFDDYGCSGAQSLEFKVANTINKVDDICEDSGTGASILDTRETTMTAVLTMARHDADKFRRFKAGVTTRCLFNAGVKSGGNWVEGKTVSIYMPLCKISAFSIVDTNGICTINVTLTAFADGLGEVYLNFA